MQQSKIFTLVYTALLTALVFLATSIIKVPVPFTNGYIHVGDSIIFIAALVLNWPYAAFAAGVGSALADYMGGYYYWVLPTLIIKAIMAIIVSFVIRHKNQKKMIVFSGVSFSVLWIGFNLIMKQIISTSITEQSTDLIGEVDGVSTMQELLTLRNQVEGQLLWIALLIPLLVIIITLLSRFSDKMKISFTDALGMAFAGSWMVLGYYIAYYLMYGNYIVPIFSVPWNIVQFIMGFILAFLLRTALVKTPMKKMFSP